MQNTTCGGQDAVIAKVVIYTAKTAVTASYSFKKSIGIVCVHLC